LWRLFFKMILHMNKIYVSFLILLSSTYILNAQNKRELRAEIDGLKETLSTTQSALSESRNKENVSLARAESFEAQLEDLKKTNAQLLKSMSTFMETSTQKTDNIGRALETLREKEEKLKTINETLKANDSTALMLLTDFKKTLGEEASITVENGAVSIRLDKVQLFGSNAANVKVETDANPLLKKLATVLKSHRSMFISVEGNTATGSGLDLATRRAAALVDVFTNTHQIVPERIGAVSKIGAGDALYIKVHPNFDTFYLMVRNDMKH
jgi:outer membrane protein OmpA-like peptidoglycan-associated protein